MGTEGINCNLPMEFLPRIHGEPTIEIHIHMKKIICEKYNSVQYKCVKGCHVKLALFMGSTEYKYQSGMAFVPPYNPGNY